MRHLKILGILVFASIAQATVANVAQAQSNSRPAFSFSPEEQILSDAMGVIRTSAQVAAPRPDRMKAAELTSRYCRLKLNAIPRLSPREQDWLDVEIRSGGERLGRALRSREWKIYSAYRNFADCVQHLDSIRQSSSPEEERVQWASLAVIFVKFRFMPDAEQLREVTGLDLLPGAEGHYVNQLGIEIISHILPKRL